MDTLSLVSLMTRVAVETSAMDDDVQARLRKLDGRKRVPAEAMRETLRDLSHACLVQSAVASSVLAWAVGQEERIQALEARLNEKD
jgi:hypothetical protein